MSRKVKTGYLKKTKALSNSYQWNVQKIFYSNIDPKMILTEKEEKRESFDGSKNFLNPDWEFRIGEKAKMAFRVLSREFESIETFPGFVQLLEENWVWNQ